MTTTAPATTAAPTWICSALHVLGVGLCVAAAVSVEGSFVTHMMLRMACAFVPGLAVLQSRTGDGLWVVACNQVALIVGLAVTLNRRIIQQLLLSQSGVDARWPFYAVPVLAAASAASAQLARKPATPKRPPVGAVRAALALLLLLLHGAAAVYELSIDEADENADVTVLLLRYLRVCSVALPTVFASAAVLLGSHPRVLAVTLAAGHIAVIGVWLLDDGVEGVAALVASIAMVAVSPAFLTPVDVHRHIKPD